MPHTHRPFTDATWDALKTQGLTRENHPRGWEADCDLAYQLAERTHLTVPQARTLVSAVVSGLPVTVEWSQLLGDRYAAETIETSRNVVIVESVNYWPGPDAMRTARIRVRYWGFAHDVYLSHVTDITVPIHSHTYRNAN